MFKTDKYNWLGRQGLVIVLLFAFSLMSLVVLEQNRTIESQRRLIRNLFHDTVELNALKIERAQERDR